VFRDSHVRSVPFFAARLCRLSKIDKERSARKYGALEDVIAGCCFLVQSSACGLEFFADRSPTISSDTVREKLAGGDECVL
jgi:hypothetical protein